MIKEEIATAGRRLEYVERNCTMEERLARAAERIASVERSDVEDSRHVLRREQVGVFLDFAQFLKRSADPNRRKDSTPTGRIILPPRTGKTVIAGQIIAASGLMTVFIVPTKTLVEQTAKAFREQLVGIPVGTFYGDEKQLVMWGVNVTTYDILQSEFRRHGCLPPELMHASLIFADEGHRSMTAGRQNMLTNAFDPQAIRVAVTATPNYNAKRRLGVFYRDLIHEINISEAIELEMVAPVRVWIAAVDVDGSRITMKAGDFDERRLGKLMRKAPFFEAARSFRYDPMQQEKAALICCTSQQQALTLHAYWCKRLPKGKPAPGIILGTTSKEERQTLLRQYETGEIDTLINVGVLIEGWNAPRCKLLIDLAPSCSWVRATQKFFRPMTKWEDREAAIFMLVPKDLPVQPVIPMDLFEWNASEFEQGQLIASKQHVEASKKRPIRWAGLDHLKKVIARTDVIFDVKFEKPKLDMNDDGQVRSVLRSVPEISPRHIPAFGGFRRLVFRHQLFTGRGENLLRFCRVAPTAPDYLLFMARFFPEAGSDLYCQKAKYNESRTRIDDPFAEESFVSLDEMLENSEEGEWDVFGRVVCEPDIGDLVPELRAPDFRDDVIDTLSREELRAEILPLVRRLRYREREVLKLRYGIRWGHDDLEEDPITYTLNEVGAIFKISCERVRQIELGSIRKLQLPSRRGKLYSFWDPAGVTEKQRVVIGGKAYDRVNLRMNSQLGSVSVHIVDRVDKPALLYVNVWHPDTALLDKDELETFVIEAVLRLESGY